MICEQIVCITISYHFKQGANLEYVIECWNTVRRKACRIPFVGQSQNKEFKPCCLDIQGPTKS